MVWPAKLNLTAYLDLREQTNVVQLDGSTSDYIILSNVSGIATDKFTIEINLASTNVAKQAGIVSYWSSATDNEILLFDAEDLQLFVGGTSTGALGIDLTDGVGHHLAATWQSSDGAYEIYVDGKLRASGTLQQGYTLTTGGTLVIGQEQDSDGGGFSAAQALDGDAWDFRWWDDIRTATEILEERHFLPDGSEAGLVIAWHMNEGSGSTITDEVGSQDGTLNGGTWATRETDYFTEITDYFEPGTFSIEEALGNQLDTLTADLTDWDLSTKPQDWDEIVVLHGSTRIFGGYLMKVEERVGSNVLPRFNVQASDYGARLDKIVVKEEWTTSTDDDAIISALFDEYLPGFGYSDHVEKLATHTRVRFNRSTLREAINSLADFADAHWYIDYERELHYFSATEGNASFDLSDNPDYSATYPFADLKKNLSGHGNANRIEVVGGLYLSADQTFHLSGNGQDERIQLPFKSHAPDGQTSITVERNDGTEGTPSWTALTVKVGHIDELGGTDEVLHYFQEQVLEQQNAWPNLPNACRVTAQVEIPLRSLVTDQASFNHYGMWFDDTIVDRDITDKNTAKLAGQTRLAKFAMGQTAFSLLHYQPGAKPGESIKVTDATLSIDDRYLIQRQIASIDIAGKVVYEVELGTYNPNLIDLMLSLWRNSRPKALWREDEVLDELHIREETLALLESTPAVSETSPPYDWGPTTTDGTLWNWGFGKWG